MSSWSTMINANAKRGTTSSLLHIVAYEVSPKSSPHPLPSSFRSFSFPVALFSPLVVRFFLPPTDYTLVGAAVSRDSQDTKRWNEREDRDDEERTGSTDVRVDPPSGIARLICPITLNNPRDNSIGWVSWDRSRGRLALSQLSAICECKFPFPRYTRIARLTTRN